MNDDIPERARLILNKAKLIIDTTPSKNAIADRWLSLANRQLHKEIESKCDKVNCWGVIGASIALKNRYEKSLVYLYQL